MTVTRIVCIVMAAFAVFAGSANRSADAAYCGSQSSVSKRCFDSVYKVCIGKHLKKSFCHSRADACRTCADKIAKCRAKLKSFAQCGTCTKAYDTCMRPLFKGITNFN